MTTSSKSTYKILLALLAVVLMLLPFVNLFNDFLTQVVQHTDFYKFIELYITPHIVKIVIVILRFLGLKTRPGQTMFLVYQGSQTHTLTLSWNCLGWQSLAIFLISLATGLQGQFTFLSKLETLIIGILGTFLLNLARIVFLVLGIVYANQFFVHILHDYLAVFLTLLWLLAFWWYSYTFVLQPKTTAPEVKKP